MVKELDFEVEYECLKCKTSASSSLDYIPKYCMRCGSLLTKKNVKLFLEETED